MLRDQNRAITAPWVPPLRDSLDVSNFDEYPEEDEVRACVRARVVHGVGGGGGGDPCLAHRWSRTVTTGLAGMLLFRVCVLGVVGGLAVRFFFVFSFPRSQIEKCERVSCSTTLRCTCVCCQLFRLHKEGRSDSLKTSTRVQTPLPAVYYTRSHELERATKPKVPNASHRNPVARRRRDPPRSVDTDKALPSRDDRDVLRKKRAGIAACRRAGRAGIIRTRLGCREICRGAPGACALPPRALISRPRAGVRCVYVAGRCGGRSRPPPRAARCSQNTLVRMHAACMRGRGPRAAAVTPPRDPTQRDSATTRCWWPRRACSRRWRWATWSSRSRCGCGAAASVVRDGVTDGAR